MPRGDSDLVISIYQYFGFYPSKAAAIVALVLLATVSSAILLRTALSRTWFMVIASAVGYMEVVGFGLRIGQLSGPSRGAYIAMECLLIIPPSFLALVDYLVLGKLVKEIQLTKPLGTTFRTKPKFLTWVFFSLEIGSLVCQGAGAGLSVNSGDAPPPNPTAGKALLIVGLATLALLIGFFILTTAQVQCNPRLQVPEARRTSTIIFGGLYVTSSLLFIRNVFRVVEFSEGWYGWIATHEVLFYCLDSLMIFLWLLAVVPLHFGVYLKRLQHETAPLVSMGTKVTDAYAVPTVNVEASATNGHRLPDLNNTGMVPV